MGLRSGTRMLDELPEGPFGIICSFYEHLAPTFQRLTLQQLEAAPQEARGVPPKTPMPDYFL